MQFDPEKAFRDIAHGDNAAYAFLLNFFGWFHTLDDLIDRDHPPELDRVMEAQFCLLHTLAENTFFTRHKTTLLPVLVTGMLAYMESERFRLHDSVLDRVASQVLKSQYQDVFYYTAFLTGGFSHMLAMSRLYRSFDYDPVPPPS